MQVKSRICEMLRKRVKMVRKLYTASGGYELMPKCDDIKLNTTHLFLELCNSSH